MTLLVVENLSKHFTVKGSDKPLVAVGGVSFEIGSGEALGLVGESGSGKTTVGRIIVGLETATSGSVRFEGREISSLTAAARRELTQAIQIIFQDPGDSLNPRMRAKHIVGEALMSRRLAKRDRESSVEAALMKAGLVRELGQCYPHELSGGAQQKVALARALVADPRFLILDEPTSALDARARQELIRIINSLRYKSGLATLLISHDLTAVRGHADRVAVMYLGEIVEIGSTDQIFENPRHPYTRALLASVPRPDPTERRDRRIPLRGEIPSPIDLPIGCYLRNRCPRAIDACARIHPTLGRDSRLVACIREQPSSEYFDPYVDSTVGEEVRRDGRTSHAGDDTWKVDENTEA